MRGLGVSGEGAFGRLVCERVVGRCEGRGEMARESVRRRVECIGRALGPMEGWGVGARGDGGRGGHGDLLVGW